MLTGLPPCYAHRHRHRHTHTHTTHRTHSTGNWPITRMATPQGRVPMTAKTRRSKSDDRQGWQPCGAFVPETVRAVHTPRRSQGPKMTTTTRNACERSAGICSENNVGGFAWRRLRNCKYSRIVKLRRITGSPKQSFACSPNWTDYSSSLLRRTHRFREHLDQPVERYSSLAGMSAQGSR